MTPSWTRWFRSSPPPSEAEDSSGSLDEQLARLEREATEATYGIMGTPLNRAGDLCMKAGDRKRALSFYGRAIDAFLEDQQPEAARGVAQKLIRLHPKAVRTLCTLTWLDVGSGHRADALANLERYVEAVIGGGNEKLAREQILEMGRLSADRTFLRAAADALLRLEDEEGAAELEDRADRPQTDADPDDLRLRCFAAAVASNELRRDEDAA